MAPIKALHDRLVISVTDGKKLGEVKDIYLDRDLTRMVASTWANPDHQP